MQKCNDIQILTISNEFLTVELSYKNIDCDNTSYDKTIELNENGSKILVLKTIYPTGTQKKYVITGLYEGSYLHTADNKENCYTAKLIDNFLIFSLSNTFFSFDIDRQEIKWKVMPDAAALFEFYDLEDDFLLRGELGIYRIDKNGNVKWRYGGHDIWVNIEGKREVEIKNGKILLTDFSNNKYVINFDGETLVD